jgi:sialic acid synthase SpsE/quercetin dioxygenase-like cupin family protein
MKEELIGLFKKKEVTKSQKPLIVLDIANNHNGDINHGLRIIREFYTAVQEFKEDFIFGIKFQYRDLDSFIHPDYKNRKDIKYVKRFSETRLSNEEFKLMKSELDRLGFISICTPFDEKSVDLIEEHNFDIIKIGSCSLTDWPLLEKISQADLPIIASTASYDLEEIDKVVSFFEHRKKDFVIMHCVGEYPTQKENLQLNQIEVLKKRYPNIAIGFSTHEEPDNIDSIKIAVAKNAEVFERHVNVESDNYSINAYSSTPIQIKKWLESAKDAYKMCGVKDNRHSITEKEKNDLRELRRGVFAKFNLKSGDKITNENVFYAIPCNQGQLLVNDMSKYMEYTLEKDIKINEPINFKDINIKNLRENVLKIIKKLKEIILESHIVLLGKMDLELSHHYGIEKYEEFGAAILNCINREYCKKLIIILPKQKHPSHYHVKKEETFQVLYGELTVNLNGKEKLLKAGEIITIERNMDHGFSSEKGCIFEEVSTTHYKDDSFYADKEIEKNKSRKTEMTFWSDWLYEELK